MKSDIRIWRLIIIQLGEGYMKYSAETKPGMGDPYWYEWSVGQQYIIDMLNPDNNIKCVELQANVKLGLDDVVVTYEGGQKIFSWSKIYTVMI